MKRPPGSDPLHRARTLRREQTEAEKRLWSLLRSGRMLGHKFRRQVWIAGYIADFVCLEARMIVEADGGQHAQAQAYDEARSAALAREGFRVLRFWNHQILGDPQMVADTIAAALDPHPPTAARRAPPSPQMGEG
jgi:very-short-patch-repair endonuclease